MNDDITIEVEHNGKAYKFHTRFVFDEAATVCLLFADKYGKLPFVGVAMRNPNDKNDTYYGMKLAAKRACGDVGFTGDREENPRVAELVRYWHSLGVGRKPKKAHLTLGERIYRAIRMILTMAKAEDAKLATVSGQFSEVQKGQ